MKLTNKSLATLLQLRGHLVERLKIIDGLIEVRKKQDIITDTKLPWHLYVLECEDECYYIGISTSVPRRFKKHLSGTGSWWTKQHPPVSIIFQKKLGYMQDSEATIHENRMAAKYVMEYGADKVRGGCFIQKNPRHFSKQLTRWLV